VIISKCDFSKRGKKRGYIAMLAVDPSYRKMGIATRLVELSCKGVKEMDGEEVVLETEVGNAGSLGLYKSLGFIRDKRLAKYYLCGSDAFRLKLLMK
jgi:peptide alpha-N-acetyltransferase